ncbi:MAG: chemotaxis protein CheW [Pseudomonadota bacterium]
MKTNSDKKYHNEDEISMTSKKTTLVAQEQALPLYMDSLLGVSRENIVVENNNANDEQPLSSVENSQALNQSSVQNQTELKQTEQKNAQLVDISSPVLENLNNPPLVVAHKKSQILTDEPLQTSEDEAPSLDLSLFLPKIPSPEELDIIEKKEQSKLNHQLKKELNKSKQVNLLLKGQLEESLKKLDDYSKTHTEVYAPDWAHPSFQVILFNVGNLKLALPLNDLNSIVVWDEKYINQMPGSEEWYLGIIQHQGKSVPVIDTLKQVVPPEKIDTFVKKRGQFKNIIIINDESWGLVCEEVIGIKTLFAEEVKWRSNRTSRRWLYGTVKEHMCALLDSDEFASMLRTGEGSLISGKTK